MATTSVFDERKAAQATAFLLFMAGGKLPLIKLVKLLYLAERGVGVDCIPRTVTG
jgi:hypothetical protein